MSGSTSYEHVGAARFRIETDGNGGSQIVIPAQRSVYIFLFGVVWVAFWTVGGFASALHMWSQPRSEMFPLSIGVLIWFLGAGFVAFNLLWMIAGREVIKPVGGDLESRADLLLYRRRCVFRGSDIRDLVAQPLNRPPFSENVSIPLVNLNKYGVVAFSYGDRTRYLGDALDETEGEKIVSFLRQRLPKSAFEQARD